MPNPNKNIEFSADEAKSVLDGDFSRQVVKRENDEDEDEIGRFPLSVNKTIVILIGILLVGLFIYMYRKNIKGK